MKRATCPHCGQPGISAIRKMLLGLFSYACCSECGRLAGAPNRMRLFVAALFIAWIPVMWIIDSHAVMFALGSAIAAMKMWAYHLTALEAR